MADFLTEVRGQPEALQALLDAYASPDPFSGAQTLARGKRAIVFAGMGASLFASHPAVTYLTAHGLRAQAADAGELLHYAWPSLRSSTLLIAVSQSGESFEIASLVDRLRSRKSRPAILAVSNGPQSTLARRSDLVLPLYAGEEEATTSQTYVNSLALLLLLAKAIANASIERTRASLAPLPGHLAKLIEGGLSLGRQLADFLDVDGYLPLIGRGPSIASALHGALVLKEAAGLGAEGFSAGGFRHGPFEMVGPGLSAVVFAGGRTAVMNRRLGLEMAKRGARVALVAPGQLPGEPLVDLIVLPDVDEFLLPILEIVPMQFLAIVLGRKRGREPGDLHVSGKVVRGEW